VRLVFHKALRSLRNGLALYMQVCGAVSQDVN